MRRLPSSLPVLAVLLAALTAHAAEVRGTWAASPTKKNPEGQLHLQLRTGESGQMGITVPRSAFQGLSTTDGSDTSFTLPREAGTFTFEGRFQGGQGAGHYRFAPSEAYAKTMAGLGYAKLSPEEHFHLALTDVTPTRVKELAALGYKNIPQDELLQVGLFDVTPDYVRGLAKEGYGGLSLKQLIAGRIHGLTPEFIQQMRGLGFQGVDLDELTAFRIHGITPDFVKQMRALGYSDITPEQLVSLRIHGIDEAFVRSLSRGGNDKAPRK